MKKSEIIVALIILILGLILFGLILHVGMSVMDSTEDSFVMSCISQADLTDEIQRELCLEIMRKFDFDEDDGYRGDLYKSINGYYENLDVNYSK